MNRYIFSSDEKMNNHICHVCLKLKCNCQAKAKLLMLQQFIGVSQTVGFGDKQIDVKKYIDDALKDLE